VLCVLRGSLTSFCSGTSTSSSTDVKRYCCIAAGKSKLDIKQLLGGLFGGKKFCVVIGGMFYIFDKGNSKKQNVSFPLRGISL